MRPQRRVAPTVTTSSSGVVSVDRGITSRSKLEKKSKIKSESDESIKTNGIKSHIIIDSVQIAPAAVSDSQNSFKGKNGQEEYEVEEIVDYSYDSSSGALYFVKWKGWPSSENTWEPPENVSKCYLALIRFFNSRSKEIEELKERSEYVVVNGRKRRKGGGIKLQLPPDPRPLEDRAQSFYETTRFPTKGEKKDYIEEWKKSLNVSLNGGKGKSYQRWPRTKLDKSLKKATAAPLEPYHEELRKQLMFQLLDEKRQKAQKKLKKWEAELNLISDGKPSIKVENNADWIGPPTNFTYINDYIPDTDVTIPDDPPFGCSCTDCSNEKKTCCASHFCSESSYNFFKKIRVPIGTPVYECNKACTCGPECPNRVVQDGRESLLPSRLCIFRTSNGCGWGVKTQKLIKKGSFVSLYLGEVIRSEEAERRGKKYDAHGCTYLFDLDINEGESCPFTVDAARFGNITHFINHSCDPNLAAYNVWVNCLDPNLPKLALFATRDIKVGEELSFNYKNELDVKLDSTQVVTIEDSESEEEDGKKKQKQPCLCGAPNCKKFLF